MFQSPHCRGSPFGIKDRECRLMRLEALVSIPSLSGQSVRRSRKSLTKRRCRGFNPLTVGAVRSARCESVATAMTWPQFQSPHCRGSPFGQSTLQICQWYALWFQSPHCRGSPFGVSRHTALRRRRNHVSIPSLSGQSVRQRYTTVPSRGAVLVSIPSLSGQSVRPRSMWCWKMRRA